MADGDDPFVSVDVSLFALDSGGSNFGRRLGISLLVGERPIKPPYHGCSLTVTLRAERNAKAAVHRCV